MNLLRCQIETRSRIQCQTGSGRRLVVLGKGLRRRSARSAETGDEDCIVTKTADHCDTSTTWIRCDEWDGSWVATFLDLEDRRRSSAGCSWSWTGTRPGTMAKTGLFVWPTSSWKKFGRQPPNLGSSESYENGWPVARYPSLGKPRTKTPRTHLIPVTQRHATCYSYLHVSHWSWARVNSTAALVSRLRTNEGTHRDSHQQPHSRSCSKDDGKFERRRQHPSCQ